VSHMRRM